MSDISYVDYGPLGALIGVWEGDKGMDIAPEPDGRETNPYYETITFSKVGDVTNAESQLLAVVYYRQVVRRKSDDNIFHDECGYWMWDAANGTVMNSFSIPRGVSVVAIGKALQEEGKIGFELSSEGSGTIAQSPFMASKAATKSFHRELTVDGNCMRYKETTTLDIYGREFAHTDENELIRQ